MHQLGDEQLVIRKIKFLKVCWLAFDAKDKFLYLCCARLQRWPNWNTWQMFSNWKQKLKSVTYHVSVFERWLSFHRWREISCLACYWASPLRHWPCQCLHKQQCDRNKKKKQENIQISACKYKGCNTTVVTVCVRGLRTICWIIRNAVLICSFFNHSLSEELSWRET